MPERFRSGTFHLRRYINVLLPYSAEGEDTKHINLGVVGWYNRNVLKVSFFIILRQFVSNHCNYS